MKAGKSLKEFSGKFSKETAEAVISIRLTGKLRRNSDDMP
ncbi:MAG: hypothetical protein XD40_0336 [Archaeoglobus fulgidus]|jgi:hypothetical protein|uniref:Uncharacterized protein n=2 Tax=Archaeoglobus fulgidus TaxID=2234 RepID=A0A075WFC2_ARCFL|nr:hypothetical protein AFULGI_00017330 [Archaeoglobus fulgidus DSM 8774]KUJ94400.1 MAG: hypothetical protein XD40_0336 [Archaeoglobus fulgidus]